MSHIEWVVEARQRPGEHQAPRLQRGELHTPWFEGVNAPPPAGRDTVNCGTALSKTEWGNDDACEGPLIGQAGVMVMAFGLCVLCFVLGAGALALSMNRELRCRRV